MVEGGIGGSLSWYRCGDTAILRGSFWNRKMEEVMNYNMKSNKIVPVVFRRDSVCTTVTVVVYVCQETSKHIEGI